ncbi:LPS-assembly protein LptD [Thiothrix eikelboomii]|uniref:LPS-assembly protein LptD n=1 Tax=Thiothrix eikelboomii TaxID=92487 RepID=UPI003BAFC080
MLLSSQTRLLVLGLSCSPSLLYAQTGWEKDGCAHPRPLPSYTKTLRPADLDKMAIYIEADQALFREQGDSELTGKVHISQNDQELSAQQALYNRQTGKVLAKGQVNFKGPQVNVTSQELEYNLNSGLGKLTGVAYLLNGTDGRGESSELIQESSQVTRLKNASYTTCPVGVNSWSLKAEDIKLDRSTEQGTARQVTLNIRDRPLLYLPYFSFPLTDQRKSGFLIPNFGTDEKSGLRISLPYYWNLAPNYDLTLTTNMLSKRGLQVENEFRYLTELHHGVIQYDALPNDQERQNTLRYHFDIQHLSQLDAHNQLKLQAAGVSDKDYFDDLGSSLAASTIVNLERTLSYTSQHTEWDFSALAQSYQILDNSAENYARLPQLQLTWTPTVTSPLPSLSASSEYTYFSRSQGDNGHRLATQITLKQRFENAAAYLEPKLKFQQTDYQLEQASNKSIHRSLPTFAVDAGLFFERELKTGKRLQTLEPRIYYTYTPFREQANIPIFDSSERSLSYSQLFNDNDFTGKDRIADNNRLSTSITTRLQELDKGREIFRASLGQMYYFADRKVSLPDETAKTGSRSEVVMEMAGELNDATRISGTAFADVNNKEISAGQVRINYQDQKERILNLGYSQRKGEYESAQIAFATPVTQQWTLVGAHEQDLKNDRSLETLAGLEYQSCCWKSRLAARKYLLSDNATYDDALFVELELKGLGSFGSGTRNLMENRIYGYK